MSNIFTENNLRIVNSFKKKFAPKDNDEWEQLKHIIIWKAATGFDPTKEASFETYLYIKTYYEVMKYNKRYWREKNTNQYTNAEYLEKEYQASEDMEHVRDILSVLPKNNKEILTYRFIDMMTAKEIQKIMELSKEDYLDLLVESVNLFKKKYA
jgi:RNA polymerase sigma factor (sigma-70 family)